MEKNIKNTLKNVQKYVKNFFLDEKSILPFVIIIIMTILLFHNTNIIVNTQKTTYESYKIANELIHYNILNYIYMFITFLVVSLLFIRFIFFINLIEKQVEREKIIRKIIEIMRSSISINAVRSEVVKEIGAFLKADRVFFADFDSVSLNFSVLKASEYKSSEKVKSFAGNEVAINQGLVEAMKKFPLNGKDLIFSDLDKYLQENNLSETNTGKIFRDMGCISTMGIHINYGDFFYGDIVVTFENKRKINEEDIDFIRTLAKQAGIALYQSEVYQKEKEMYERESLLRNIFETMRSSLDVNKIKNTIVNKISKVLNADRCFLIEYHKNNDAFTIDEHSEYRSSSEIKSLIGTNFNDPIFEGLINLYKANKEVIFSDVGQFINESNFEDTSITQYFIESDIKANYCIPIFNAGELLGVLCIQYTKDYHKLLQEDIDFLRIVAIQAGEAICQAKLYQKMQFQAERERINRSIIEILRSSIDKPIIKKLFVENIGKFFNADRVFFSEYDSTVKKYLPVDKNSEYLSSNNQKSFVGFDWSNPLISGYINPLLEKREIKITNLDEYIKKQSPVNKDTILRYVDFDVKSSYNFPVLYQSDIKGYFCVEFTSRNYELSDEDIKRIRSICVQAGIALYHSELYLRSQQYARLKESSVFEILEHIKEPTNNILDSSIALVQNEFERKLQIEYLDKIIYSCNLLLGLTNSIS